MATSLSSRWSGSQRSVESLQARYGDVRRATLALVAPLSAEDQMLQSMPGASPAKWHLAHTAWFFETFILRPHSRGYRPIDERFQTVFNSYYKQVGDHPNRANRGLFSRPTLDEVIAYREYVDEHMVRLIGDLDPERHTELPSNIELGLQHEQQHQELILTDIKHAFWSQPLRPAYRAQGRAKPPQRSVAPKWESYSGGIVSIGHSDGGFCFDSELPRHEVLLRDFRLQSRLVTNREYLEFIEDGGYHRPELWLSNGWDTVMQERWEAPLYWERHGDDWRVFTLAGVQELRLDEPICHVSYFEADAFARWKGTRLPLESEWEHAASDLPITGNFVESGALHPEAATSHSGTGLRQMFGDVWEWTSSPYVAYPGFRPATGALGEYNGKFMCDQWVLRGGSCATPESHIRPSYRNFFPAPARWQFTGIRLAADAE
ncbi:MAG TPA: ergothioneine biosynthesis protein EgtB [Terriglobales bacterium]|nr:ergothioneine biosynthesis protein EgtB [Terriglobales bacterium]